MTDGASGRLILTVASSVAALPWQVQRIALRRDDALKAQRSALALNVRRRPGQRFGRQHARSGDEWFQTRVAGSTTFIALHAVWFATWIVLNATRLTFDAYPFSLLNLVVALEAVFLTSVVLMTQNRMAQLADRRAHLDLQVNMLAEQELTAMLHMLHGLCTHAGVSVSIHDEGWSSCSRKPTSTKSPWRWIGSGQPNDAATVEMGRAEEAVPPHPSWSD